jgi:hypothetical protein
MRTTVWWCSAVQDMHLSQCVTRLCCYSGFTKDASVTPGVPVSPNLSRYKQLEADGDEDDADLVEQVSAQLFGRVSIMKYLAAVLCGCDASRTFYSV